MPKPNAVVDTISSLSVPIETLEALPAEVPESVTVDFQGGRSGLLDMTLPRSRIWAEVLDSLRQADKPAYVEIDPETNGITELLLPRPVKVGGLTPTASGDAIQVDLITSHALHYLRRSNPDFQELLAALQAAQQDGSDVLVTETLDSHEIVDARPLPKPLAAAPPPAPPPSPPMPLAPVTLQEAQQLFDLMNAQSCDPCTAPAPCIPFKYPNDGCWARAHEMCRLMINQGAQPGKVWIYGSLHVRTANNPYCQIPGWGWHVAPTLLVDTGMGTEVQVVDPSLFFGPVTKDHWKSVQGDPNAVLEESDASVYRRGIGQSYLEYDDANYTKTKEDLDDWGRTPLKLWCAQYGPSPYSACLSDIFLRDNLQDTGQEPLVAGGISASPDINHFRQELTYPEGVLGTAAAQAQDTLFEPIEFGQPNFIYLRLQNRGYAAVSVDVDVYYALPSTLPTPGSWNPIGSLSTLPIVPGELKVVGPLVWNTVPQQGHYCFVAVLGNAQDPKPNLAAVHTIDEFYAFIREHNNVTWKNFDVVNMFAGSLQRFQFWIRGWPRIAYLSDLEIDLSELPAGSTAELRLLKRLTAGADVENMAQTEETDLYVHFAVSPLGRAALRNMQLKTSDQSQASLTVTLPETAPDGAYQISVLQNVGGREMGRVTKRLLVGEYPYVVNANSDEVHLANCPWVRKMSPRHRVAYSDLELARRHGHNGCHFCLPAFDTG